MHMEIKCSLMSVLKFSDYKLVNVTLGLTMLLTCYSWQDRKLCFAEINKYTYRLTLTLMMLTWFYCCHG